MRYATHFFALLISHLIMLPAQADSTPDLLKELTLSLIHI